MYRCMLVPLDGTAFGEHALPLAVSVARRSGATLHLAHVHLPRIVPSGAETAALPPAWIEMTWDEKKQYLEVLAAQLRGEYAIRVETRVLEGSVAGALEHQAMSCAAGLIVMSTHGHVGLSRLWHHGVADQLSRDLPLPILLVRPGDPEEPPDFSEEPDFGHILLPLDGSAEAEAVLPHAVRLGRSFAARYTLLRVIQPETVIGYSLLGQDAHLNQHRLHQELTAARQYLNAVAERMRSDSLEVKTEVVVSQDPAGAVLERVRSSAENPLQRIGLVALDAHPRSAVTRLIFRSTADALLRESPVPVLLFQAAPAAAPEPATQLRLVGGA